MKKIYDEASVVRSLSKKNDITVNTRSKVIEINENSNSVGNGSWGKIDYLCKVHGYCYIFKKAIIKAKVSDVDVNVNNKTSKREAKLNMANMTKAAMRRNNSK